eukprot:scaffold144049_cov18-Tisochrysis_lutea.AAC.1
MGLKPEEFAQLLSLCFLVSRGSFRGLRLHNQCVLCRGLADISTSWPGGSRHWLQAKWLGEEAASCTLLTSSGAWVAHSQCLSVQRLQLLGIRIASRMLPHHVFS